jgi:hypothetical protein
MAGLLEQMQRAQLAQQRGLLSHTPSNRPTRNQVGRGMADALQSAGLLTAPIPVLGDAVGLLGDAAMYAAKPEERTWGNAGMTLLGALPFVPSVAGQAGKVAKAATKWERVPASEAFSNLDKVDDYLYHVTSEPSAKKIIERGLTPRKWKGMFNNGGYDTYSQGKAFLTDRNGVSFWQEKVDAHLFDQFDDPPAVSVLRIPRSAVADLADDAIGTRDARAASYFTTKPVK